MKILAIETSCDDTGIAVLSVQDESTSGKEGNFVVLANEIASQIKVHQKYGGVFPAMAKREHQKNTVPTFVKALKKAKLLNPRPCTLDPKKVKTFKTILEREPELLKRIIPFLKKYSRPAVDYIAVTNGPGLEPCLWVGVNFARALSYFWDIPIIPVNHIEGHILVNFFNENSKLKILNSKLPTIALVVSGGHTQIVLVNKIGDYKILGETRDDAAGECFDKAAKILGLGYPGGPIISKLAQKASRGPTPTDFKLPRPMMHTKDYDFSFSGLKTAILYKVKKDIGYAPLKPNFAKTKKGKIYVAEMCTEIQQAIIDVLLKKTLKAVKDYGAKTIILGGGVSANSELKKQFQQACDRHCEEQGQSGNLNLVFPEPVLSTDNGAMIAIAGYYNRNKIIDWKNLSADSNLRLGE